MAARTTHTFDAQVVALTLGAVDVVVEGDAMCLPLHAFDEPPQVSSELQSLTVAIAVARHKGLAAQPRAHVSPTEWNILDAPHDIAFEWFATMQELVDSGVRPELQSLLEEMRS